VGREVVEISRALVLGGTYNPQVIKEVIRVEIVYNPDVFNVGIPERELDQLVTLGMLQAMKN
jgi:hypothetical protein